jgi:hypothetical protein
MSCLTPEFVRARLGHAMFYGFVAEMDEDCELPR